MVIDVGRLVHSLCCAPQGWLRMLLRQRAGHVARLGHQLLCQLWQAVGCALWCGGNSPRHRRLRGNQRMLSEGSTVVRHCGCYLQRTAASAQHLSRDTRRWRVAKQKRTSSARSAVMAAPAVRAVSVDLQAAHSAVCGHLCKFDFMRRGDSVTWELLMFNNSPAKSHPPPSSSTCPCDDCRLERAQLEHVLGGSIGHKLVVLLQMPRQKYLARSAPDTCGAATCTACVKAHEQIRASPASASSQRSDRRRRRCILVDVVQASRRQGNTMLPH